jgi:hypothetical protein
MFNKFEKLILRTWRHNGQNETSLKLPYNFRNEISILILLPEHMIYYGKLRRQFLAGNTTQN